VGERHDRRPGRRPADEVGGGLDAERVEQGRRVVRPVREAAGGVEGLGLGVPEAAHVRRDHPEALGDPRHQVLVEAARGEVAVQQHQRNAVRRPGLEVVHPEAVGVGGGGPHPGQQRHAEIVSTGRPVVNPPVGSGWRRSVSRLAGPARPG
jgi:hypothetical protein